MSGNAVWIKDASIAWGQTRQCAAMVQAPKALKQLELRLGRVLTRVVWLVCSVVFILHVFACIFHFSALVSNSETTWVDSSGIVDANSIVDLYVLMRLVRVKCMRLLIANKSTTGTNVMASRGIPSHCSALECTSILVHVQVCDIDVLGDVHDGDRWIWGCHAHPDCGEASVNGWDACWRNSFCLHHEHRERTCIVNQCPKHPHR